MKKDTINLGLIGCGWIVEYAHIPAIQKNENVKITALFDTDIQRVYKIGEQFHIEGQYDNFEEFITSGLDGVVIATPNFTHTKYTLEALKRGIAVLCEKPVAMHVDEVEQIIQASKENSAIYVPGFVNRWRQDIQKIYKELSARSIGELRKVEAGWIRKCGVPRPGTWFTNREYSGGGVLTDLGSHIMDICMLWIGDLKSTNFQLYTSICNEEKIKQSGAASWFTREDTHTFEMDVEDTAIAHVSFEQDVILNVKLSWLASVEADCTYFRIIGTEGRIELKTLFGFSNERLWKEDVLRVEKKGVGQEEISEEVLDRTGNNSKLAFEEMHKYFIDAIRNQKTDFTNYEDAKRTVHIIEQLYQNEVQDEEEVKKALLEEKRACVNFF